MDLDVLPIIPDEPKVRREPYNQALAKIIRANDHKILGSYVRFEGSAVHIELTIQCDKELAEKFHAIRELEIKEDPQYLGFDKDVWKSAQEFIEHLRERGEEPLRYQGDNPF